MIIHYLKITLRHIANRSGFSTINLLGLTIGLTAFLFIFQFVSFEKGYNLQYKNIDHLYRVLMVGEHQTNPLSPPALAPEAAKDLPQIQAYSRLLSGFTGTLSYEVGGAQKTHSISNGVYADGNLLDLLGHPLERGRSPVEPYALALSNSMAEQLFGGQDPVGRSVTLHNQFGANIFTISGVFPDLPEQSDWQFELLFSCASFNNIDALNQQGWAWLGHWDTWVFQTYLQLAPEVAVSTVEEHLNAYRENLPEQFEGSMQLQALSGLHLGEGPNAAVPTTVSTLFINFLLLIGFLILMIAWINYINLAIAQSLQRIKAIGVQKVLGAGAGQIWMQYLIEATTFNLLALLLAVGVVAAGQPFINDLVARPLGLQQLEFSSLLTGAAVFILAGVLISGIYIAVVLSAFHPIQAVKGVLNRPGRTDWVRKGMLIFQFAISTGLIIGTGLMWRQLHFMQESELGTNLDQVLLISGPQLAGDDYEAGFNSFQQELERLPYISRISFSGLAPGEGYNFQAPGLVSPKSKEGDDQVVYASASVDEQYFDLYNIPMLAGRNFRAEEVATLSWYEIEKVVLNETAVEQLRLGSPEAAVGQNITWWGEKSFEVIGVVPDHHHMSLQEAIRPMVFLGSENFGLLGLKVQTGDLETHLYELNELYTRFFPGNAFHYFFADENFAEQYDNQKRSAHLFGLACSLAVFIACLGLLGLSIAGVRRRTKEVGIRRVLGATARQVIFLLSRDYFLPIALAFVIAIPIVGYLIRQWLQDFAYRIGMEWWVYVAGSLLVLVLAMFTVGVQAWRAAQLNPVESLRSE